MTNEELKAKIENESAAIENGGDALSLTATAAIYGGEIPFDLDDGEEIYYDDAEDDWATKVAAFIVKDENGEVTVTIDNGSCYPPVYTVNEFAKKYGE